MRARNGRRRFQETSPQSNAYRFDILAKLLSDEGPKPGADATKCYKNKIHRENQMIVRVAMRVECFQRNCHWIKQLSI